MLVGGRGWSPGREIGRRRGTCFDRAAEPDDEEEAGPRTPAA